MFSAVSRHLDKKIYSNRIFNGIVKLLLVDPNKDQAQNRPEDKNERVTLYIIYWPTKTLQRAHTMLTPKWQRKWAYRKLFAKLNNYGT